jgi:transcriptional regulator with XRE-family HTH domain
MNRFNFGENLRNIRSAKGVTQEAMAAALNISQSKYSRIERQKGIPKTPSPSSIAKALGVPVADLLPPVEELVIVAARTPHSDTLQLQPKAFLSTTFGKFIIIASCMLIIDEVYQATHGICEALGTTDQTLIITKWIASLTTMGLCIIFVTWKRRK